ncbi:MAG: hypothetical protein IJM26_01630 [Lachnospiraceae bacterium]|nr:hypothetical protein [Lachnospiraceae bacterium]
MGSEQERALAREELLEAVRRRGFSEELGRAVADQLRTEKMMRRMTGYLRQVRPGSEEELVDEMLAILEDRERWVRKKTAEYYNERYNELLRDGLE